MKVSRLLPATRRLVVEALRVYFTLLKILVPALVIVKGLQMLGAVEWLGAVLSPLMGWLGLPDVMGVVWAATLLTNIFTGLVVLFEVAGDTPLTVAQATVLGSLLLVGHSLPVEGAVARRAGVPWSVTLPLRLGGALLLGALIHHGYGLGGWGEQATRLVWQPEPGPDTFGAWAWAQLQTLAMVFIIIFLLMVLLRLLRYLRLERLIHLALTPLLRLLGIGRAAANVTVIGFMLGLSYGAGLVIRDVEAGGMSRRDSFLTLCFLGLCHSVIEDTLLILLLGADIVGVLWVRIVFAVIVIALLSRLARSRLDAYAATP